MKYCFFKVMTSRFWGIGLQRFHAVAHKVGGWMELTDVWTFWENIEARDLCRDWKPAPSSP